MNNLGKNYIKEGIVFSTSFRSSAKQKSIDISAGFVEDVKSILDAYLLNVFNNDTVRFYSREQISIVSAKEKNELRQAIKKEFTKSKVFDRIIKRGKELEEDIINQAVKFYRSVVKFRLQSLNKNTSDGIDFEFKITDTELQDVKQQTNYDGTLPIDFIIKTLAGKDIELQTAIIGIIDGSLNLLVVQVDCRKRFAAILERLGKDIEQYAYKYFLRINNTVNRHFSIISTSEAKA